MKWRNARGSRNIEDRRGQRVSKGGMGIVGMIAVVLIGLFFGVDVSPFLQNSGGGSTQIETGSAELTEADQRAGQFVSASLGYTEDVWSEVVPNQVGQRYQPATLVLFKTVTQSPCGNASGATGPFYCPADSKIYLDTDFFTRMARDMGAGGDFAAAYVVAHEVAHHIQNQLGILPKVNQARRSMNQTDSNRVSVMVELQADCFSGIWARLASDRLGVVESNDIAEAMNAAKQIGDDTIQRNAGRRPMPHTFTHGTSEQRQRWFARGYQTARMDQCDTFAASQL